MIWTDICKMAFSFFFIQVIFFYLSLIHNFFLSESGDYWYQLVKLWWIMQLLGCDRKRKKKEEIKLDGDVHRSQEWPFWLPHPWATYNSHPRQTDGLQWIILGPLCTKCAYFRHDQCLMKTTTLGYCTFVCLMIYNWNVYSRDIDL